MHGILSESIARVAAPARPKDLDLARSIEDLRRLPQVEMPVTHRFQEGVYIREIFMPADTYVVGHVHKTKHWNVVLTGKALVSINGGEPKCVEAPCIFESEAGDQKWLFIAADMRFLTIHHNPTGERDIAKLEEDLVAIPEDLRIEKGRMTVDEFRMSVNKYLHL